MEYLHFSAFGPRLPMSALPQPPNFFLSTEKINIFLRL